MELCPLFRRRRTLQVRRRTGLRFSLLPLPPLPFMLLLLTVALVVACSWTRLHPRFLYSNDHVVSDLADTWRLNETTSIFQFHGRAKAAEAPRTNSPKFYSHFNISQAETRSEFHTPIHHQSGPSSPSPQELQVKTKTGNNGPYHDWEIFSADYKEMMRTLKIFVYPDALKEKNSSSSSPFDSIFLPLAKLMDPKIGNYFSEHAFKVALLGSSLVTKHPEEAHFFFMPFSINVMRNHPLLHSASSISDFVAKYTRKISSEFRYWNASGGADHFYVCCHSIGRDAASKHPALRTKAIQVTCSSSYFQRLYITHKDVGLPQIWPRGPEPEMNPLDSRKLLLFFAGRAQNSRIRQTILDMWSNDTSFAIFSGSSAFPYEEGFRKSRYCLHVKGYEVNTARVCDAIHYGCIPVLISNYYDLPFANILDWSKFSIIISQADIPLLKEILSSVSNKTYLMLHKNLGIVRKHFEWHTTPRSYDAFHMTAYQLWLRRGLYQMFPSL